MFYEIYLDHKPITWKRPGGTKRRFNTQKHEMMTDRLQIKSQIRSQGLLSPLQGAIFAKMTFGMGNARKRLVGRLNGDPCIIKKDIDNIEKYLLDVMTGIMYEDDRQVTNVYKEKIYSDKPFVRIEISDLERVKMDEHAITIKGDLSIDEINYMIRKANKIGLSGRKVFSCRVEQEDNKKDYFFETDPMREKVFDENKI